MEAAKTIQSFLQALNNEDFNAARNYLADNVKFVGVMGTRDGGDVYIADMEKMKFKYDIKKVFENGDDVSVFLRHQYGWQNFVLQWVVPFIHRQN